MEKKALKLNYLLIFTLCLSCGLFTDHSQRHLSSNELPPPFIQENSSIEVNRDILIKYLGGKYSSRQILLGGPIKQPLFYGLLSHKEDNNIPKEILNKDHQTSPEDLISQILNNKGAVTFPFVIKNDTSNQGYRILFFEKNNKDHFKIVMPYFITKKIKSIILPGPKGSKAFKDLKNQLGFFHKRKIKIDTQKNLLTLSIKHQNNKTNRNALTVLMNNILNDNDNAVIEQKIDFNISDDSVHSINKEKVVETRILIRGNFSQDNTTFVYDKKYPLLKVGSSNYFANVDSRDASQKSTENIFQKILQHFVIKYNQNTLQEFKENTENILIKQYNYLITRLKQSCINLGEDFTLPVFFDVGWKYQGKEKFPSPILIEMETHILHIKNVPEMTVTLDSNQNCD